MLKEDRKEEHAQYNKKETYTYEEVRAMVEAAMEDRARYLGYFYKVMPRDLFDKYAKKALSPTASSRPTALAQERATRETPRAWPISWWAANGVANTLAVGNKIQESADEHVTVRMEGKCALVQGWERMGLSPE